MRKKKVFVLALSSVALSWASARPATGVDGRWDATLTVGKAPVPFRFEVAAAGTNATGTFFDGDQPISSTRGSYKHSRLQLHFDSYDSDLDALVQNGAITGKYVRHYGKRDRLYLFSAKPFSAPRFGTAKPAGLAGTWRLTGNDGKDIWTLQVSQQDHSLTGAILRLDGDSGALSGAVDGNAFTLSHFSGARPTLIEGAYQADGTLAITVDREEHLTGVRNGGDRGQMAGQGGLLFRLQIREGQGSICLIFDEL